MALPTLRGAFIFKSTMIHLSPYKDLRLTKVVFYIKSFQCCLLYLLLFDVYTHTKLE